MRTVRRRHLGGHRRPRHRRTARRLLGGGATRHRTSTASSEPNDGGDLTVLISNFDAGWAPSKSSISSYEGNVWGHITDKLVYVDPEGTITPWIAESWEENDGGDRVHAAPQGRRHVLRRHPAGRGRRRREHRLVGEGRPARGDHPHRAVPVRVLRPRRGGRRHDGQGRLHGADARVHPDARVPRLDPDLAEEHRAPARPAGRPAQGDRQRPVLGRGVVRGRQGRPQEARGLRLGPRGIGHTGAAYLD